MKIGFDAKRAFFNGSGLGNYSRNLLSSLFLLHPENEYLLFSASTTKTLFEAGLPYQIPPAGLDALCPSLWRYKGLGKTASHYRPDIFHGLSNELPLDIKKSKSKNMVSIHDAIFMRYPQWYKWHDRLIYEQKTAFACQNADTIIATSYQTKEDILRFFKVKEEKIEVVYQICNPIFANHKDAKKRAIIAAKWNLPATYFLMAGNIEERKNIGNVIKSFKKISSDVALVIVGRNNHYATLLKDFAVQEHLHNIFFYHDISNEELPYFYQGAKALIFASYFEGFGIPIVEALFSKIPIIASNSSCFEEIAGEAALFINPDHVDEISDAIKLLLNSAPLCQTLTENGILQSQKFEMQTIVNNLMNVYLSL
ncbi:MAG: glycosyltransferase family 4 protein [Bacteroidales bacterium]|jgi:glycosyltransferase involved in cell wall biosynthesis|nr:glycosyltransferase family 4 protein [Bacteroidales bacterium]